MTDQTPDLARLRTLAEAATPGPWAVCEWDKQTVMPTPWAEDRVSLESRGRFAAISPAGDRYEWRAADAAFVAAANPATVLALLDEIDRARGWWKTVQKVVALLGEVSDEALHGGIQANGRPRGG